MTLPFLTPADTMRRVEWWALLNCHVRPSDLPRGTDETALFNELTRELPKVQRMDFWNGAFNGGKNKHRFV